ncbi:MAG TPA: hypothetical protein PK325_03965 [Cyclobacteriaceae bacterium]|nr:hypothetical protein [Cyclobacteriaceae bacterium]HMV07358.1 hypothetical protein [Cyclobacteriaceae bacterium]HMV88836.1 hypothetical protein [Cyclobacteriaceae bacterium]HMW99287.1 hypothetical protein [Cyclobacteriaceae bacterium]HMX48924.1 hypothetical protein [Cyclobacteriaceae bacterium]
MGATATHAQKVKPKPKKEEEEKKTLTQKVSKRVMKLVKQNPGDTIVDQKSESGFRQYQGKIIRKIIVNHIGFERNINDTTKYRVVNTVTRVANSLHTDTKEQVIRNNLFFRTNKPLDPYKLADNERYLRDLPFILDARIAVKPVRGNRDMVDVIIYTRDVFSIGGSLSAKSKTSVQYRIYDANLAGWGQRTEYRSIIDIDRDPKFGHQFLYSKNSIKGTLINGTISYTQLNTGASYGLENESALFLKLDRPLVSPYTRWAGGLELSRNWSVNVFGAEAADFRDYSYYVKDLWVGYNIGIKNRVENRNRHFVGIRTFGQSFNQTPVQETGEDTLLYRNQQFVLGQFTFYNQNFYRTKYVYGFGRTEDVPYGTRMSILFGQTKQMGLVRPYAGAEFEKSVFHKSGDFMQYAVRVGGYQYNKGLQDVVMLASANLFSRLMLWKKLKIRQSIGASYTTIANRNTSLPLRIDNDMGIERFNSDSTTWGTQRLSLHLETVVYIPPTLLGFHFAPFAFADMAMVAPEREVLIKQKPYFGLGGGVRTRNENLIFGTIELRMFYFPRVTEDLSRFRITVSSNLRVKFSSSFIKAPSFISYN